MMQSGPLGDLCSSRNEESVALKIVLPRDGKRLFLSWDCRSNQVERPALLNSDLTNNFGKSHMEYIPQKNSKSLPDMNVDLLPTFYPLRSDVADAAVDVAYAAAAVPPIIFEFPSLTMVVECQSANVTISFPFP